MLTVFRIARDPFKQFAVLLLLGTLALLALDVYWVVTGSVMTIPNTNGTGGHWVSHAEDVAQYWLAVAWYFIFTAIAAVITAVVIRLLHKYDRQTPDMAQNSGEHEPHDENRAL